MTLIQSKNSVALNTTEAHQSIRKTGARYQERPLTSEWPTEWLTRRAVRVELVLNPIALHGFQEFWQR